MEIKPKKIHLLIIDGASNHDWQRMTTFLRGFLQHTGLFSIRVFTVPQAWSATRLAELDTALNSVQGVLMNYNNGPGKDSPHWPRQVEERLEQFISQGQGLFVLHSANNSFWNWPEYEKMMGMGWRPLDSGYEVRVSKNREIVKLPPGQGLATGHGERANAVLELLNEDHPINRDLPPRFLTADLELYYGPRGPAENITVLTYGYDGDELGGTQQYYPVNWTIQYGQGRCFNTTLGHLWTGETDPQGVRDIAFQTYLVRALEWIATGEVTWPVPGNFPNTTEASLSRMEWFREEKE